MSNDAPSSTLAAGPAVTPQGTPSPAPDGAPQSALPSASARVSHPSAPSHESHSPIDSVTRVWRRAMGAPPTRLDDRGNELVRVARSSIAQTLHESAGQRPRSRWRRQFQWALSILILACIASIYVPTLRVGLPLFLVVPLLSLVSVMQSSRGENVPLTLRERITTASLLRAGRCGACGFGIRALEPVDGMVVCPECGGGWHRDRWRIAHDALDSLASRAIVFDFKAYHAAAQVDDRGALLAMPMRSRPEWLKAALRHGPGQGTLPPHLGDLVNALKRSRRTALIWMLVPTVLFAVACASLVYASGEPFARFVPFFAFGAIMVAIVVVMVVRTGGIASPDARTLALTHGVCPACGGRVDPSGPREFDGCVRCDGCASAWRYTPLGKPAHRHRTKATFSTIHSEGSRHGTEPGQPTSANPNAAP